MKKDYEKPEAVITSYEAESNIMLLSGIEQQIINDNAFDSVYL